jgi:hypothetical protein
MIVPLIAMLLGADERQEAYKQLVETARDLEEKCGPIAASYDWDSEKTSPGNPPSQGPLFCKSAVEGVLRTCGIDENTKKAIGTAIKAIKCVYQDGSARKSGKWGPVPSLEGTTIVVAFDWNSGNIDSDTADWALKKMLLPGPNGPETVEAKQERPRGVIDLVDAVDEMNDKCGVKIAVDYDLRSEKPSPAKPAYQGYLYCKSLVDGLAKACETNEKVKAKVGKKLKQLHCHYVTAASDKQKQGAWLQLKKTLLDAAYDWDSANLADEMNTWASTKL